MIREDPRLVLAAFWTAGCEPCRQLRAELRDLETEVASVLAVNADEEPEAIGRHQIETFPTLVFFKGGVEVQRLRGGALPASTRRLLASSSG